MIQIDQIKIAAINDNVDSKNEATSCLMSLLEKII